MIGDGRAEQAELGDPREIHRESEIESNGEEKRRESPGDKTRVGAGRA